MAHTKLLLIYVATTRTKRNYDTKLLGRMASNLETFSQLLKDPGRAKVQLPCWSAWMSGWNWRVLFEGAELLYIWIHTSQMIELKLTAATGSSLCRCFLNKTYCSHVSQRLNCSSTSTLSAILFGVCITSVWLRHFRPNGSTTDAGTDA